MIRRWVRVCVLTPPPSSRARAFEGVRTPSSRIGFVKKWKTARVGRRPRDSRLETGDGRRRAFERAIMDAMRADGISKLMIAEKEAQAIVGAAREGA